MINEVSERIRKIIKSQDQTPQPQIYNKSRDASIDSSRSGPTNNKPIAPGVPKTPNKNNPSSHKDALSAASNSNHHSHNSHGHNPSHSHNNKAIHKQDSNQIIQTLKAKVMQIIYPFLMELSHKIQTLTTGHTMLMDYVNTIQAKLSPISVKNQTDINRLSAKLEQLEETISSVIQSTNKKRQGLQYEKKLSLPINLTHIAAVQSKYPHKDVSNNLIRQAQKCKCQRLVEEILKSQNHLMMELQYVKHFQGNRQVNKTQTTGGPRNR